MSEVQHLTTQELADRLRVTTVTVARWRGNGIGPKYIKSGGRVLYREDDVAAYENSHTRQKTRGPN